MNTTRKGIYATASMKAFQQSRIHPATGDAGRWAGRTATHMSTILRGVSTTMR